jgi:hypothetical protein
MHFSETSYSIDANRVLRSDGRVVMAPASGAGIERCVGSSPTLINIIFAICFASLHYVLALRKYRGMRFFWLQ